MGVPAKTQRSCLAFRECYSHSRSRQYSIASIYDFQDITAEKKAKHDYQLLFNLMVDGFALHEIICDEDGKPVDYRFLAVNPAFERIVGLKASDIIGKTVLEILPDTEPG